jgi:hypothetical protein
VAPTTPSSVSSSTKKAARLAHKGKGQKIRFQGGALFPFVVALVLVLGVGLIAYARQSRPAADASAPQVTDHWHHTYGFFLCDQWVQFTGNAEETDASGQPLHPEYARTGIHSHDDGLIHWHPFSSASIGRRAKLGVFLDVYGVDISTDKLEFPADQRAQLPVDFQETGVFETGETSCMIDGKAVDAELSVTRWNNTTDDDAGITFISDFKNIALNQDAMVVSIAFAPDGADIGKPPWITDFEQNVANDSNQQSADQLFPGVEVSDDGDVTVGSNPLDPADVGPAVSTLDTVVDSPVGTVIDAEPVASDVPPVTTAEN